MEKGAMPKSSAEIKNASYLVFFYWQRPPPAVWFYIFGPQAERPAAFLFSKKYKKGGFDDRQRD